MLRITDVDYVKDYELLLTFSDGTRKLCDLKPYLTGEVYDVKYQSLSYESEEWFNGYIAKTKTCANGSPETTEKYQQKYDAILAECRKYQQKYDAILAESLALIENRVKSIN